MKNLLFVLFALLLNTALLQAAVFDKESKFHSYKAHIISEKNLTVGNNSFKLTLTKQGKPFDAKAVSVKIFMPAMPGMPAMTSKSNAVSLGNGVYEFKANLAMSGTWQIHIFVTPKSGKKIRIKSSLNF